MLWPATSPLRAVWPGSYLPHILIQMGCNCISKQCFIVMNVNMIHYLAGAIMCVLPILWSYWPDRAPAGLSLQLLMSWNHISAVTGYRQLQCWLQLINYPIWNDLHYADNVSICLLSLCGNPGRIRLSHQDSCWYPATLKPTKHSTRPSTFIMLT